MYVHINGKIKQLRIKGITGGVFKFGNAGKQIFALDFHLACYESHFFLLFNPANFRHKLHLCCTIL